MTAEGTFEWDVFVSYASEDRDLVVRPLVDMLTQLGLSTWWDQLELKVGDSLIGKIDMGLASSQFGVVIISPSFLAKRWTERELRGLTAREMEGGKVVLPAWYGVSVNDVLAFSPPLADKKAVVIATPPTQENLLDACLSILEAVRPDLLTRVLRRGAFEALKDGLQSEMVDSSKLIPGPLRHDTLPDDLISRIRLIRASLLGGYPRTMRFWVDGFRRDAHPSDEILVWERIASAFLEIIQTIDLTPDERTAVAYFLIGLSDQSVQDLPDLLGEHREYFEATFGSKMPIVELETDESTEIPDADPPDPNIEEWAAPEDFANRFSPELARLLADRSRDGD